MDTLVDPVEVVSWSQVAAAPRVEPPPRPRGSFQSLDPEAQVQWFARPNAFAIDQEPSGVDIDVSWEVSGDDETDVDPTLVLRKRTRS